MNRLLTGTAVALLLGMTPALAQDTDVPADEAQTPPAASQDSVQEPLPSDIAPPEVMPEDQADPAEPIPDRSSEIVPPDDGAMPPMPKASELDEPVDPDQAMDDAASLDQPMFDDRQDEDEWLASSLIGQSVVNADNDAIGDINDVVTNENGEVVAVLIGVGGFLGIGEKEVALRYQDLSINRDEAQNVTIITSLSNEMLTSAPDYERLSEQSVTVGENSSDIQKDDATADPGL